MITKKTTFILGAGSSMAYGFPSGKTLKALIWKKLELKPNYGPYNLRLPDYLYSAAGYDIRNEQSTHAFETKVKGFRDNLILSPDETIDYFLEHVAGDEYREIGRFAIASILLEREQKRYLFDDWMEYFSHEKKHQIEEFLKTSRIRPEDRHWYQFLFNQMCRGCETIDCFPQNNVSIVTFNYDRSFEYYFLYSLMAKYKVNAQRAAEILNQLTIVHVYGQIGELPELIPNDDTDRKRRAVPYTALSNKTDDVAKSLKNAADGIQLIWDNTENNKGNIKKAQDLIESNGNRIVFLGFGYDPINLNRIMPNKRISQNIKVYGTILDVSMQNWQAVKQQYTILNSNGVAQALFVERYMGSDANYFKACNIYNFLFNSTELFK